MAMNEQLVAYVFYRIIMSGVAIKDIIRKIIYENKIHLDHTQSVII